MSISSVVDLNLLKSHYISKNRIVISNIPNDIYLRDILCQKKYFGQYGHIIQIFFDNNINGNKVIIEFDTNNQAALAILFLYKLKISKDQKLNVNYFITKYCNYFLKNEICINKRCFYLHDLNINQYLFCKVNNYIDFDCFQFALNILNLHSSVINIIKLKVLGNDYYIINKKFPKITLKKLKNKEYVKKILLLEKNNEKKNEIIKSLQIPLDYSLNISNSSYNVLNHPNWIIKRKKSSRFNFVKVKENNNYSPVFVPEFVLDLIDKTILDLTEKKKNYCDNKYYINDFNYNWSYME